jgi:hypothetical protein
MEPPHSSGHLGYASKGLCSCVLIPTVNRFSIPVVVAVVPHVDSNVGLAVYVK